MIELTAVDREDGSKGKCLVSDSEIVLIREYETYCTINLSDGEEIYVATSFKEIKEKLAEIYPSVSSCWIEIDKTLYDTSVKGCLVKSNSVISVFEYPNGTRIDISHRQSQFSYTVVTEALYGTILEKFKKRMSEQKQICENIKRSYRERENFRRKKREKKGFKNSDVGD